MKLISKICAVAALAITISAVQAAPFTFNDGDLILGVQASSGIGSTKNVFLNLGPGVNHRNNGDLGQLANVGATLTSVFGANWYGRSDLYFGVVGNLNTSSPGSPTFTAPVNGDPSRTFYISLPASAPGTAELIAPGSYVSSALGSAGTKLFGMEQMLVGSEELAGLDQQPDGTAILDQGLQTAQWNNGWTAWNPVNETAFGIFSGGIQQSFGQGGDATFVDVQRILATNTGANPTGTVGGGTYITTISISNTGIVTALTPVPSVPEIEVDQPLDTPLVDGTATRDLGTNVAVGSAGAAFTFVIRNTGAADLTGIAITKAGSHTDDFVVTGPAVATLAPSTSTTFTVQFQPSAAGNRSAELLIASNDEDENPFNIQLTGTGVVPEIEIAHPSDTPLVDGAASLNLGNGIAVGSSGTDFTFDIRNTGTADLTGIAVTKVGSHTGDFVVTGPAVTTLAPSASTTFTVKFQPLAAGSRSAELRIASNDADENPFNIQLAGSAFMPAPEIVVEQPENTPLADGSASLNLGSSVAVGTDGADFTFVIRNTGTADLTGLAITKAGSHDGDFVVTGPAVTTLAPSGSTTFTVKFQPQAAGSRSAELLIASNDADENPFNIQLTGSAFVPTPEIAVEQPANTPLLDNTGSLDLGTNVALGSAGADFTFVIRNTGTADLTGIAITKAGSHADDFVVTGPAVTTLAPAASTTFIVKFEPQAEGSRSAELLIASNDGDENPFNIQLTGSAFLPTPEIAVEQPFDTTLEAGTSTVGFGTVATGQNGSPTSFRIMSAGTGTLNLSSISVIGANPEDFVLSGPSAMVFGPGEQGVFTLQFSPSASGTRTAVLRIESDDADESPFDIQLTGTGVQYAPEIVVEQPADTPLVDGIGSLNLGTNLIVGTDGAEFTFVIRNTGNSDLTDIALSKAGSHPNEFTVVGPAVSTLSPNDTTSFTVKFQPQTAGNLSAELRIASNDGDENPFNIQLTGSAYIPAPEIVVEQPADTPLVDGSASLNLGTNLAVGTEGSDFSFVVRNTGTADMTGIAITKAGSHADDFVVTGPAVTTLAPAASTTFTVKFQPQAGGTRTAELLITSNDDDENPFNIQLTGSAYVPAPEIVVEQPADTPLVYGTASLNLGTNLAVGSMGSDFSFVVRNTGTADLTGIVLTTEGSNPGDFIVTGPGAETLAPAESTTFTVKFQPQAAGTRTAELLIASNDGDENPFNIQLTGSAYLPAPEIEVEQPADTALVDGIGSIHLGTDIHVGSSGAEFTFVIRNTGTANMTGIALTKAGSDTGDFIVEELGISTLAPSASTTFTVRFQPQAAGNRSATLQIASNDADENPFDITLEGTSVIPPAPEIVVEQPAGTDLLDGTAALDFGSPDIGTPVVQTVTVRNNGSANLTGLALSHSGTHAADFVLGTLGATTLGPAEFTTFTVTFTPSAAGTHSAALQIASNDADENPFDISLGGSGVIPPAPEIVVEQPAGTNLVDGTAALAFGNSTIGTPVIQTVTVRNTGTANLSGLALTHSGTHAADFVLGALGSTSLAPGANTTFTVTFTPSAAGTRSAALQIASNDADENPFDIALGGSGVIPPAPEIVVEYPAGTNLIDGTAALAFGSSNIGTPVSQTITIRNTGTANLSGLALTRGGTHATDFVLGALGSTTLVPGANTTFMVTFTPSAAGTRSAALQIASNDADENPFDIALGGSGVTPPAPEIVVEYPAGTNLVDGMAALAFGSSTIGTPLSQTVTVRNTGTANLSGLALTRSGTHATDFVLGALGSTTLVPGANTTFTVTFTPSAAGTRSAALRIASNDADENPFDIALGGSGVTPTAPEIVVEYPAGTNLTDGAAVLAFGSSNIGRPVRRTVTVRNTGTANLTGLAVTRSGTNAADFAVGSLSSTTLAPGVKTTFTVTFTPSAAGTRSAALKIASNDADENPFNISLSGNGLLSVPKILVEQPAGRNLVDGKSEKNFGKVVVDKSKSMVFTIKNTGSAKLTGLAVSQSGPHKKEFIVKKPGAKSLQPGASTTFKVIFKPSAKGPRKASLRIKSNDPKNKQFDIKITGLGVVR